MTIGLSRPAPKLPAALLAGAMALLASGAAAAGEGFPMATLTGAYLGGIHATSANDLDRASAYMTMVLDRDPANLDLRRRAFQLQLRSGDMEAALRLARSLDRDGAAEQLAATLLLLDDVRAGRFDAALDRLQSIDDQDEAGYLLPLMEAWLHAAQGDRAGAMRALDGLAPRPALQALTSLHRGLMLEVLGDAAGAETAYEAALSAGQTQRLVLIVGSFYERHGKPQEARALYESFLAAAPENLTVGRALERLDRGETAAPIVADGREGLAEILFQIASVLQQEDADETALLYSRFALLLKPAFPAAQLLLGSVLVDLERPQAALVALRAARGEADMAFMAQLRTADALASLERVDEAVDVLTALADERRDRAEPLVALGDLYRRQERFAEAVTAYDQAMTRAPEGGQQDWSLLYKRGIALERDEQWDQAEADLQRALDLNPNNAGLLNYLGYLWADRGKNLEEAEALISRAVEMRPDDGFIIDSLGWVYYRTGRYDEAVEMLERAVELEPEDTVLNDHLGDAYWQVGRRTEARFQWHRALRTAEEADVQADIQGKLAEGLEADNVAAATTEAPAAAGQNVANP